MQSGRTRRSFHRRAGVAIAARGRAGGRAPRTSVKRVRGRKRRARARGSEGGERAWERRRRSCGAEVRSIHWSPYDRVRRGERRSLRTLPGASLRPPLAFNPRPRRLSTPTDAFQLHPDVRSYGTTLRNMDEFNARDTTGWGSCARRGGTRSSPARTAVARVLTTEWIEGRQISGAGPRGASGLTMAQMAVEACVAQLTYTGFVHADPHEGNMLLDERDGGLVFLDFGLVVGRWRITSWRGSRRGIQCMIAGDWLGLTYVFRDVGMCPPEAFLPERRPGARSRGFREEEKETKDGGRGVRREEMAGAIEAASDRGGGRAVALRRARDRAWGAMSGRATSSSRRRTSCCWCARSSRWRASRPRRTRTSTSTRRRCRTRSAARWRRRRRRGAGDARRVFEPGG